MATSRSQDLILFRDAARGCVECRSLGLVHYDTKLGWGYPLFHEGATCPTQVIVVGEAPNWDDTYDQSKRRLTYDIETDPTGNFARDVFATVGLAPCDMLFTNGVLCLPTRRGKKHPVRAAQSWNCLKWLKMAIDSCNAKVVVTLGGAALDAVGRLSRHHLTLGTSAGKAHAWNNRLLFPLYHPGRLGRIARPPDRQIDDIQPLKELLFG
jgi:uracil-DNA glycosylase family 4